LVSKLQKLQGGTTNENMNMVEIFLKSPNVLWMLKMSIRDPHLINQKDETSRLQGSHPNGVTQVYSIGKGCRSDSIKHDVQINMWLTTSSGLVSG
jgi:hypothetical protein